MSRPIREFYAGELVEVAGGRLVVERGSDGTGRRLSGYAYRWGELSPSGESFERGAFAQAIAERGSRPFAFLNRHRSRGGSVVGGLLFREDAVGLAFDGELLDTQAARDYAAEAAIADGVSLEVIPGTVRSGPNGPIHTAVRRIAGLAGEYVPAFTGSTVAVYGATGGSTSMRCQHCNAELQPGVGHVCLVTPPAGAPQPMAQVLAQAGQEPVQAFAAPVQGVDMAQTVRQLVDDAVRALAERGALITPAAPPTPLHDRAQYPSIGHLFLAAGQSDASPELRAYAAQAIAEYALDDTVSTAGANAALLTGNLTVRQIAGIVSRGRPAITAFGGPRPISDVGLSVTWPYFDGTLTDFVGAQSAQKAEITSAALDIKLGTEALVTYAGGSDVAYQLIQRGDPSILDALARVILTAWGVVTDAAFVTELESGSVTSDLAEALSAVDYSELIGKIVDNSIVVETATGAPADFALASSTAFAHFAKLIIAQSNQLVSDPNVDLRALRVSVGGLPIIHVPSVTAGKTIISNTLAAGWHEAGPFQASADDVAKLGRNVAYWSMGAGARYIPAGIIEMYDVTP
jgi:hypothetical protein